MRKKFTVFTCLLVVICLSLTSCKKDNDNNPKEPPGSTNDNPKPGDNPPTVANPTNVYDVEVVKGVGTGATLYVATDGNDGAAGTITAPLKTLNKAVSLVKPGGIIIMRAGTYQGAVINTGFGTADAWVTLKAAPGESVTLQGNPRGSSVATIYFYTSSCDEYAPAGSVCASAYWRIKGLKIMSTSAGGADANAVKIDMPHVQIDSCNLCCAVPDIIKIVRTANNVAILNSEIYADPAIVKPGGNSQGIDITGADNIRVIGNYLHDLPDVAMYAKGNARKPIFACNRINNTGFGSASGGYCAIMLGQQTDENRLVDGPYESYDGLVVNNIISNVSGAALAASSSSNSRFYHNTCYMTALRSHSGMLISTEGGIGYTPNKGIEFVNNVFIQSATRPRIITSTDREYTKPTEGPLVFKNNIYWSSGTAPTFIWIPKFYNEKPFDQWQAAFKDIYGGTDLSLNNVNPLLTLAPNNFEPQAGSAAIKGAATGYATYDYSGKKRTGTPTIGAIEIN
ncbi:DUF1565 domain-containing protein [Niastella caeni]|nr:DUF1565 domain-containing protein [Niastella caeni]